VLYYEKDKRKWIPATLDDIDDVTKKYHISFDYNNITYKIDKHKDTITLRPRTPYYERFQKNEKLKIFMEDEEPPWTGCRLLKTLKDSK
jgi:glutaredoxin-related protein